MFLDDFRLPATVTNTVLIAGIVVLHANSLFFNDFACFLDDLRLPAALTNTVLIAGIVVLHANLMFFYDFACFFFCFALDPFMRMIQSQMQPFRSSLAGFADDLAVDSSSGQTV